MRKQLDRDAMRMAVNQRVSFAGVIMHADLGCEKFPECFVKGRFRVKRPPTKVCINPISEVEITEGAVDKVNSPKLGATGYERIAC